MRPTENIKRQIKNIKIKTNPEVDEAVLNDLFGRLDGTEGVRENTWRVIVHHKMTKFAIAAVIIVAALLGLNHFGGSIDGASVAWAEVVQRIENVDFVHFYDIETKKDGFTAIREGWYAHGKARSRRYREDQWFDDGETWSIIDERNNVTAIGESILAKHENIFEAMTYGILSFNINQVRNKTPISVGSDFLIYEFDPSGEKADWIEKITVTVGRNSLMPIQIKTYFKHEKWYINRLLVFDYEAQEKPEEFFELPTEIKPPHGVGRVVLGGEEIEIKLHNVPGIKKAIVRLHTKFEGPAEGLLKSYRQRYERVGEPMYFMEIAFATDENYRSNTSKDCPLWLEQGAKAALGIEKTWPDNKYRYILYTPVLRATDKENVFNLELSCWLKTKQLDL